MKTILYVVNERACEACRLGGSGGSPPPSPSPPRKFLNYRLASDVILGCNRPPSYSYLDFAIT